MLRCLFNQPSFRGFSWSRGEQGRESRDSSPSTMLLDRANTQTQTHKLSFQHCESRMFWDTFSHVIPKNQSSLFYFSIFTSYYINPTTPQYCFLCRGSLIWFQSVGEVMTSILIQQFNIKSSLCCLAKLVLIQTRSQLNCYNLLAGIYYALAYMHQCVERGL